MPTKKKRVGFIPREDVMKIIDKLSIENNLSNSKIISILVEEALSIRGIISYKTGTTNQSYQEFKDDLNNLADNSLDINTNSKFKMNTKILNNNNQYKINFAKQINHNDFDLQTYKKFISFLKFKEMLEEYND
tara:strand:- start:321 stop:719 length:399 start_codon:yes stop_codon:yes gene_type:complete